MVHFVWTRHDHAVMPRLVSQAQSNLGESLAVWVLGEPMTSNNNKRFIQ
jgi:hypothetical protein